MQWTTYNSIIQWFRQIYLSIRNWSIILLNVCIQWGQKVFGHLSHIKKVLKIILHLLQNIEPDGICKEFMLVSSELTSVFQVFNRSQGHFFCIMLVPLKFPAGVFIFKTVWNRSCYWIYFSIVTYYQVKWNNERE